MVNISLARIGDEDCCVDCFGDCLSAPVPCACARDTGVNMHTPDGLVKPEFIDKCISMNRFPEEHHKVFCRTCPLGRSRGALKDEEALCLDGTFYGNVGRFINHRCRDANLAMVPVQVETPDRHYYHAALFTSRKVEALEELTWDYGIDFEWEWEWESGPVKVFECLCGSKYCRGSRQLRHGSGSGSGNGNGKKRSRRGVPQQN
ncbi:hypothetical protein ZWY2020_014058 [Hordeum vulgare]|nr:hypothetical protein ZWY2020_014058 [Hordeum vulgare]